MKSCFIYFLCLWLLVLNAYTKYITVQTISISFTLLPCNHYFFTLWENCIILTGFLDFQLGIYSVLDWEWGPNFSP